MVSRRSFFSITLMMVVLLFLFQFTVVIKDNWNEYEKNEYWQEEQGEGQFQAWSQPQDTEEIRKRGYTVFIGEKEATGIGSVVSQWCEYTKKTVLFYSDIQECVEQGWNQPEILLVDGRILDEKDSEVLVALAEQGTNIVFCSLPDKKLLTGEDKLSQLLGIQSVKEEPEEIQGVCLFSGFLLGGEVIYEARKEEEQKLQDFEMTLPWYVLNSGTKVYMAGMTGQETMDKDNSPPIIWRNSYKGTMVFGVNGDYMEENTGIGILNAVEAEMGEYAIYPVINAQNLTIVNYPVLASENSEAMKRLYSRSQRDTMRDIIWSGIAMIAENSQSKLSCMLNVQFDYQDENLPNVENLVYYLKLLKELNGEMGISLEHQEDILLEDKIAQDSLFWEETKKTYKYGSMYISKEEIEKWLSIQQENPDIDTIRTIVSGDGREGNVIGYVSDNITLQSATADGFLHTYRDNLRIRSLETALGYSNVEVDLKSILWPEKETDRWELQADAFARNFITYWKPFTKFQQTVLLESDKRIRNFLAMDYEQTREGNRIFLRIEAPDNSTWFILRTHGEDIKSVEGGEFQLLEEDAYLIKAEATQVEISLKKTKDITIYDE